MNWAAPSKRPGPGDDAPGFRESRHHGGTAPQPAGLAKQLDEAVAGNRRSEAVALYFTKVMQMPMPAVAQMRGSPMWPGLGKFAHTLAFDLLITARGPLRLEQVPAIRSAALVMDGGASPGWVCE